MDIKVLNPREYIAVSDGAYIAPQEFSDELYVVESDVPRYYRYYKSLQKTNLSARLTKDLEFSGICDSEMKIFIERTRCFREPMDISELQKEFPTVSGDQIEYSLCRAIIRMDMKDPDKSILLSLVAGSSKRELMKRDRYTLDEINLAEGALHTRIQHYCFSEYEKKYLVARVESLYNGQVEFLYTTGTFCKRYAISEDLIKRIVSQIIQKQSRLTSEEKDFMTSFLNERDYSEISGDDKTKAEEIAKKIIKNHRAEKDHFFEELALKLEKNKQFDLTATGLPNEYSYEIQNACRRLGIDTTTWRKACSGICRSKKLRDYLEE